jgi:TetR/AcrR family transcriptional repressor of mexJK operon
MSPAASIAAQRVGRPRRQALAARHDALLETALALFVAHGYTNVSLLMVARAARVAIRTIYVKFGGKPGLLDAVIAAEGQRHGSELEALELDTLDARARLERLARHMGRRCARSDLLRLQAIVAAETDPRAAQALHAAGAGQAMAVLRAVLSLAGGEGWLRRDLALAQLCAHFFSCVCGSRATLWAPDLMPGLQVEQGLSLFLCAVMHDEPATEA